MKKLQSQWIVGFVDGEGCFHVAVNKNKSTKFGYQILPEFTVVQHASDIQILHRLKSFWNCGVIRTSNKKQLAAFRVREIEALVSHIIPFFEKHSLHTKKKLDFLFFRDIVRDIHLKKHLVQEISEKMCERIIQYRKTARAEKYNEQQRAVNNVIED
jgi:hypothetical protein